MRDELSCDYRDAELNHLRDALALSPAQRWQWLREAMDFGFQLARSRAAQGLVTLGPHGDILWSPALELDWQTKSSAARTMSLATKDTLITTDVPPLSVAGLFRVRG